MKFGATKTGKIRCNCLEYEEAAVSDSRFRCEHILAVKYAVVAKNTESATKQPVKVETQIEVKQEKVNSSEDKIATESRESVRGEQRSDEVFEKDFGQRTNRSEKSAEPNPLANIKGKKEMKQENLQTIVSPVAAKRGTTSNVLDFTSTLKRIT